MNIKPFIFNWNRQFNSSCKIEDALKEIFNDVYVINTDDNNTRDGWINLGDECYFSDKFNKALELFDGDILFHIQGDVSYHDWKSLVEDAKTYINYYNPGIYAPNIDYSSYTSERTDIKSLQSAHSNIAVVANTDETVWFIQKEIIHELLNRKIDFSQNKMGWGWDLVLAGISFLRGQPVLRDYKHTVQHPCGTNYDITQASNEMIRVLNSLDPELKRVIDYITSDKEKLAIYLKTHPKLTLSHEKI